VVDSLRMGCKRVLLECCLGNLSAACASKSSEFDLLVIKYRLAGWSVSLHVKQSGEIN
jgi:hypothetical protein